MNPAPKLQFSLGFGVQATFFILFWISKAGCRGPCPGSYIFFPFWGFKGRLQGALARKLPEAGAQSWAGESSEKLKLGPGVEARSSCPAGLLGLGGTLHHEKAYKGSNPKVGKRESARLRGVSVLGRPPLDRLYPQDHGWLSTRDPAQHVLPHLPRAVHIPA